MVETESLANKIFSLLKGNGLKIKIFDVEGMETTDPTQGRRFFVSEPNIMITIDEDSNNVEFSKGANVGEEVSDLQKNIRRLSDEFLMNSVIKVFGKSIQPRDYAYQAKNKKTENMMEGFDQDQYKKYETAIFSELKSVAAMSLNALLNAISPYQHQHEYIVHVLNKLRKDGFIETVGQGKDNTPLVSLTKKGLQTMESLKESFSKMFGSLRTSHQVLENVRILVKHKTPVDESVPGARTRHISAIFLECNGERFRFPHNYLPGARAMAQHLAHGGAMADKVGSYITESTAHLLKLQSFNRYVTTNKLINEDSSSIVETVKENIETIRTELKKLTGVKTYETVKARLETFERQPLAEDDVSGLKDLFTIRRFDEKFEEVLPIVKQLIQEKDTYHKRIEEAAGNVVLVRRESINTTPMFEFASENARLGFKINELALRILENEELAGFINKIGTKLCKEGQVNDFEKAVLSQVFENIKIEEKSSTGRTEIKEATDLVAYFDKYDYNFI